MAPCRFQRGGGLASSNRADLIALLDELQHHTHQLHDCLNEIQNSTSLELPLTDADLAALHIRRKNDGFVREESPLYLVS